MTSLYDAVRCENRTQRETHHHRKVTHSFPQNPKRCRFLTTVDLNRRCISGSATTSTSRSISLRRIISNIRPRSSKIPTYTLLLSPSTHHPKLPSWINSPHFPLSHTKCLPRLNKSFPLAAKHTNTNTKIHSTVNLKTLLVFLSISPSSS